MREDIKDRCDRLLKLADFRMARIVSRRDHEWKVTVELWALLAAGIAHPPTKTPGCILVLALVAIVIGHAVLWVYPHWRRSKEDTITAFGYTDEVERLLHAVPEGRKSPLPISVADFVCDLKCLAQVGTTAILALCLGLTSRGYL